MIVGRWGWQAEAVAVARVTRAAGVDVPVVGPADLILLKLYAGGYQDLWDIEQLLATVKDPAVAADVDRHVGQLPAEAGLAWTRIRQGRRRTS